MDVVNLADAEPFTTKDGSEIRELLQHRGHGCITAGRRGMQIEHVLRDVARGDRDSTDVRKSWANARRTVNL